MKLESIQLRNFLSHECTDFELNGARLATIVGANGAGKSSLLDAISYTLFDAARGRTDDLVTLGQSDMSARVVFTYGGSRYAVTRGRTAKAGGKSFLELAMVVDGGWMPLTGDSIRETQGLIGDLLRVDADTFATSVLLGQGRMNAFAEATAAERKRILSTVLGLDVYARAEAEAKGQAVGFENQLANARAEAERLDVAVQALPEVQADLIVHQAAIADFTSEVERLTAARASAAQLLLDLAAALADLDAAGEELSRLDVVLRDLRGDYQDAKTRQAKSEEALATAQAILSRSGDIDAAIARAAELRDELQAQLRLEKADRDLEIEIRRRKEAVATEAAEQDLIAATYASDLLHATRAVDELVASKRDLKPVVCPECGKSIVIDQAGIAAKLKAARKHLAELEASRPKPSTAVGIAQGQIAILERRRAEAGYDPARTVALHAEATKVAALAAQGELMETHRAYVVAAQAAIAEAAGQVAAADRRGQTARAFRQAAAERLEAGSGVRAQKATLEARQAAVETELAEVQRSLTLSVALEARDLERIDQLKELGRKRRLLDQALVALERDSTRLRKLAAAFGVTGIPARIIESVLPELTSHAQALLDDLRPGLTLELRAQRAKKDGKGLIEALDLVVRDDAGERPLALFSGGERMSVSLAIAVGLSRLLARRAGTALRTLVIDEPDGLDAEARRAFGQSLRILAHQGELERVLVVSHHEDLAEVGDAQFRVSKNGHGSVVEAL